MVVERRLLARGVVVGVLVALVAGGCSGETSRSALGVESGQAESAASQGASDSVSASPSGSDAFADASAEPDAPAPWPSGSPNAQQSEDSEQQEDSGQALGPQSLWPDGIFACPNKAKTCRPWPERPASEGWVQDALCPDHYSGTVKAGVWNISTVEFVLAVRGIDCHYWSVTGNPSQITGTVLPNAEKDIGGVFRNIKWWPLEVARWRMERRARFQIGVFIRDQDGTLDYRGDLDWDFFNIHGDEINTTNLGTRLSGGEYGYACRRQSLGPDPSRTASKREFYLGDVGLGGKSPVFTIYSDGADLHGVRCRRNNKSSD